MNQAYKTIVVGAGGGGLASAFLANLRGEEVTLIEAHSQIGGCASWFRRGQFIFDVGATTLSGVVSAGPLDELFKKMGASPKLVKADPGITFHLTDGKVIHYYADHDSWMRELEKHFPDLEHRSFWNLVYRLNSKSWQMLHEIPFEFSKLVQRPHYWHLGLYLSISTEVMLKYYGLDHPSYLELINGILLISAQAHSESIPFLVGAMALAYPSETYAPLGGMKGLMDFFENQLNQKGILLKKNKKVKSILGNELVLNNGEKIVADKIIANIPVWNLAEMTSGKLQKQFVRESSSRPEAWGAFTLYFGIKGNFSELYQQVHLKNSQIKNYFVSFSIPNDELRAPRNYQSVTISTHLRVNERIDKNEIAEVILRDFKQRFQIEELIHLTIGTPKTFERYTLRKSGFVGGLPLLYGQNPFSIFSPLTTESLFYRVGDTVFPGQGLCGVVAGALQLDKMIRDRK
ncbi:MAG: phytoene desaturase family protein [Bacteriovoracaceae bacterium]